MIINGDVNPYNDDNEIIKNRYKRICLRFVYRLWHAKQACKRPPRNTSQSLDRCLYPACVWPRELNDDTTARSEFGNGSGLMCNATNDLAVGRFTMSIIEDYSSQFVMRRLTNAINTKYLDAMKLSEEEFMSFIWATDIFDGIYLIASRCKDKPITEEDAC